MAKRLPIFALFFCLLLSGCTLASLGGRFADWYAMKKIDDYFDLTEEQRDYLKPRVKEHVAWIKSVELPQVNQDLSDLGQRVAKGIGPEDLTWVESRFKRFRQGLDQRLRKDTIWLLSGLKPSQIEHVQENIEERQERWQKNLDKEPQDYREDRLERYEDNFEEWFGSITKDQKVALHAMYSEFAQVKSGEMYHKGWLESQTHFVKTITPPVDVAEIDALLAAWIQDPAALRTGDNKKHYLSRMENMRDSFLAIDKMISSEQRKHFIEKLESMRADIAAFAE